MRQFHAQFPELRGVRRADDGADAAKAPFPAAFLAPALNKLAGGRVQRLPARERAVLQLAGGGVTRLREHEQVLVPRLAQRQKRRDAVRAEVGVDRQRVAVERGQRLSADLDFPEMRAAVRLHRRADVVALAVDDHIKALFLRVADCPLERAHALPAVLLVIGALRLDGRDDWRERVD